MTCATTKRIPCKTCPWRLGADAKLIPNFSAQDAEKLVESNKTHIMACHHSLDATPYPCAGWVTQVAVPTAEQEGTAAIPMRMLLLLGDVDVGKFARPKGLRLHRTSKGMVKAILASLAEG